MPDKVAILDDGSMVELFASDDPSVWFALSSDGVTRYRIVGVWTANPHCTCPFRARENNPTQLCRHMRGIITMVLEENALAEQSTSLVPARNSALVVHANNNLTSVRGQVEGYRDCLLFCDMYAETAGVPKKFGTKGDMAVALLRGHELGFKFGQSLEVMYTVNGAAAISAMGVVSAIEGSGKGWIEIVNSTDESATVIGHREGRPNYEVTWTKKLAETAGSRNIGGWTDKLVWKAIARIGRRMFADVLGGTYISDSGGVVIDDANSPQADNEWRVEVAPAEERELPAAKAAIEAPKQRVGTMVELKAALTGRGIKANLVLDFLAAHKPTGWAGIDAPIARGDIIEAVEAYAMDHSCEVIDVVTDAQAWDASGRPAEDLFDEADYRDPPAPAAEGVASPEQPADLFAPVG